MMVATAGSCVPADAQLPGIPSVVFDPVNHASAVARYGQLLVQARQQLQQIRHAAEEVAHLREESRGFSGFRLSGFDGYLQRAAVAFGVGVEPGYRSDDLERIYRMRFPRALREVEGVAVEGADQLNAARDAAYAALVGARAQSEQLGAAGTAVAALRRAAVAARPAA
ncbi:MAG: hypothetical protein M3483_05320, partial [Gemmatimonadota bacterium]|nr:hypothetical protein [Gemmatimonadota bacterium]